MTTVRAGIEYEGTPAVLPLTPHPFWTLRRVATALGDQLVRGPRLDDRPLAGVATDTRTLEPGTLFVALRGAQHDAHDWLEAARDAGAAAVVVERAQATAGLGLPVLVVADAQVALGRLARAWRRAWGGTVVAVGGSNGKTSTKELLRAALGGQLRVHATHANQNNLIGVPLTLLGIPQWADVAVVEVGTNQPGEVATLRDVCEPDLVVVTSLGEEHLEGLGDLAGVLREEAALLNGARIAVVPASEQSLVQAAQERAGHTIAVGRAETGPVDSISAGAAHADAADWSLSELGQVILRVATNSGALEPSPLEYLLPVRGTHQLSNARLALAVARSLGVSLAHAGAGLAGATMPAMRGAWQSIGDLTVINDAYNANPPSMRAALELLSHLPADRQRVAVLGTMRELGAQAAALHDEIARRALDAELDFVVAVGEFATAFTRVAPDDLRVLPATDAESVWPVLQDRLAPNAIVLLKGSRGVHLELVLPHLIRWTNR